MNCVGQQSSDQRIESRMHTCGLMKDVLTSGAGGPAWISGQDDSDILFCVDNLRCSPACVFSAYGEGKQVYVDHCRSYTAEQVVLIFRAILNYTQSSSKRRASSAR